MNSCKKTVEVNLDNYYIVEVYQNMIIKNLSNVNGRVEIE